MFHVTSDKIWIPQLFFNNSFHHYGLGDCHPTECIVKSSGGVSCWIPCIQTLDCDADYANWPYDSHICVVAFKTFYIYEDVLFDTAAIAGGVVINTNNEWKLSSMTGFVDTKNKNAVKFSIKIERYSGTIYKHVIVPIYCLIVFSLLILWTRPLGIWRLIYCGTNVFLHFMLMDRVWWQFPSNGASKSIPKILQSMTLMLIVSVLILIESIALKVVTTRCTCVPAWGKKFFGSLGNHSVTKYVTLSTIKLKGTTSDVNEETDTVTIQMFVRIFDIALFLILSVMYVIVM